MHTAYSYAERCFAGPYIFSWTYLLIWEIANKGKKAASRMCAFSDLIV